MELSARKIDKVIGLLIMLCLILFAASCGGCEAAPGGEQNLDAGSLTTKGEPSNSSTLTEERHAASYEGAFTPMYVNADDKGFEQQAEGRSTVLALPGRAAGSFVGDASFSLLEYEDAAEESGAAKLRIENYVGSQSAIITANSPNVIALAETIRAVSADNRDAMIARIEAIERITPELGDVLRAILIGL